MHCDERAKAPGAGLVRVGGLDRQGVVSNSGGRNQGPRTTLEPHQVGDNLEQGPRGGDRETGPGATNGPSQARPGLTMSAGRTRW